MIDEIIYKPFSPEVMDRCISIWNAGGLPALDLQLTDRCNASCPICDSPEKGQDFDFEKLKKLIPEAKGLGLEWIYVCGLKEPLLYPDFREFLDLTSSLDVNVSFFTNGIAIDDEMARFLKSHKTNLIVKYDTLDKERADELLGGKGLAEKSHQGFARLLSVGYGQSNPTDLCLSIVPTTINIWDIYKVIQLWKKEKSEDSNIAFLIGELECAGRAKEHPELYPSFADLCYLMDDVEKQLGHSYVQRPCPATIASLHINTAGQVIVDKKTGLSCPWHECGEPDYAIIGTYGKEYSLAQLLNYTKRYRVSPQVFGGCGGRTKEISAWREIQAARASSDNNTSSLRIKRDEK